MLLIIVLKNSQPTKKIRNKILFHLILLEFLEEKYTNVLGLHKLLEIILMFLLWPLDGRIIETKQKI